jgi:hypothetical protein
MMKAVCMCTSRCALAAGLAAKQPAELQSEQPVEQSVEQDKGEKDVPDKCLASAARPYGKWLAAANGSP